MQGTQDYLQAAEVVVLIIKNEGALVDSITHQNLKVHTIYC